MQTITIREILDFIETGQAFSMKVVSYDRKRKKGGSVLDYPEAELFRSQRSVVSSQGAKESSPLGAGGKETTRRPNHGRWYTRNIRMLQNGHPTAILRKIHPPLIIEFNNQAVVP